MQTVRVLCEKLALLVQHKVLCALYFFATGSFQAATVGSEETMPVSQSTRLSLTEGPATIGSGSNFFGCPKTSEEKAAMKEGFLWRGAIPDVIGCVDSIIAPKDECKAAFMCQKGNDALNPTLICAAVMRSLAMVAMPPGSDHDSFVWRTTWLRRRFQAGRIGNSGEYLLSVAPDPSHPPTLTAEGKYNTADAAMRSGAFRRSGRYRTLLYEP
ncbi:hypothetical protein HPB49_008066 [Dermacentor silvarum]|uniref:Uncharacterized protein n=1 Tax=Dermacentor silvarum TaxID=543639 RepID=A0ACB8CDR6_DERSI|nr:hypothetical protein HPB49_008066 [Dermacentor silvarum]